MSESASANVSTIGLRVRAAIDAANDHLTIESVAARAHMTSEGLSSALDGERPFSSMELARIAESLHADIHFLITGHPDPYAVDSLVGHELPAIPQRQEESVDVTATVQLAYKQARSLESATTRKQLPRDPAHARKALGPSFAYALDDSLESSLGIDVFRLKEINQDFSLALGSRPVVLVPAQPLWFEANRVIAHHVGHICLRHATPDEEATTSDTQEVAADAFAAELLLPADVMRRVPWHHLSDAECARLLWVWGVSCEMLASRLATLGLYVPRVVGECGTLDLMRRHIDVIAGGSDATLDPISLRLKESAARRVPVHLIAALVQGVAEGGLNPNVLAWLLSVDESILRGTQGDADKPQDIRGLAVPPN